MGVTVEGINSLLIIALEFFFHSVTWPNAKKEKAWISNFEELTTHDKPICPNWTLFFTDHHQRLLSFTPSLLLLAKWSPPIRVGRLILRQPWQSLIVSLRNPVAPLACEREWDGVRRCTCLTSISRFVLIQNLSRCDASSLLKKKNNTRTYGGFHLCR